MKLLVITQKIDKDDAILGFFHGWVSKLSEKFSSVSVVCLEKGNYDLPENVRVYSLGKESGRSKIKYVKNFFNLILGLHKDYDRVFVHMNQEYILLGGFIWKILRKKIYFWRNHPSGSLLTAIAVALSDKVFCTSNQSFTAKYQKTSLMPAGVDSERFAEPKDPGAQRVKNSILFLGRISPVKNPELLIEALNILKNREVDFLCDVYGDTLPKDQDYFDSLKAKVKEFGLEGKINFYGSVPNYQTPAIYGRHEIFVNLTENGSFDKTIFEAALCGCLALTTNTSLQGAIAPALLAKEGQAQSIAETISFWLRASEEEKAAARRDLKDYVLKNHSLDVLIEELTGAIQSV